MCLHSSEANRPPISSLPCDLLHFLLFQPFLFFFFNLFVPNIMFLFSCLIKYGFLCCVVDFSPFTYLVQLSPLTSALKVTEGNLSLLRSSWPCGFSV